MKKGYVFIIIGVIVVAAIIFVVARPKQSALTNKVMADDNSASLIVPDGIDTQNITLHRLTAAELELPTDETEGIAAYDLGPDGTSFDSDLTFTTQVSAPDGLVPRVYHISEGEMPLDGEASDALPFVVESVDNVTYTYDAENQMVKIDAPVRHFSTIVIDSFNYAREGNKLAFFKFSEFGDSKLVGEGVKPKAVVSVAGATELSYGEYPDNTTYREVHEGAVTGRWFVPPAFTFKIYKQNDGKKGQPSLRFSLVENSAKLSNGVIRQGKKNILSPNQEFKNKPSSAPLQSQYSIPSSEFTCAKADYDYVEFDVKLSWQEKAELQRAWDPKWRTLSIATKTATLKMRPYVQCKAPATSSTRTNSAGVSITDPDPDKLNCQSVELMNKEAGGKEESVYKLKDNRCYTADQFTKPTPPDACKENHYHYTITSLDGHSRNDSQPCGAAVDSDIIKKGTIWIKP
ncbi:MAG: hypothetical protein COT81_01715 [Candidatus Buchananbacteria bacterium CG10_big_fil_rev_8_21_14_0_10_42_9]|uniref:Uncharacterized protein n=1 Tax=Candidatus Buchananbacteria bacterium CG10_big_fil_rev_8_21_14_0_10_42_9 TaxID=1974526 RepID=A0A2H0W3V0_9BACT|nr:MAG: hypothetical protein COT81_01715 [Candidatus Buchananbacteria bacterium CG10_big_fil_rev_8_21_14_0_10_42_9]